MLVRRDLRHGESDGLLPVLLAQRISIRSKLVKNALK